MSWRDRAACRDKPTAMFYPPPGMSDALAAALAVCNPCPVKGDCLRAALCVDVTLDFGIQGGTTARQRSRMRRTAPPVVLPNHGTTARYHRGCKCSPCLEANTEYHRRRKLRNGQKTA